MKSKYISEALYIKSKVLRAVEEDDVVYEDINREGTMYCEVDLNEFASSLRDVYEKYDSEGYDVVNVLPVNLAKSQPCYRVLPIGDTEYVGDITFSVTGGAVVVGKRREDPHS